MKSAFGSWSGGKDCCHACYLANKSGMKVDYLLNMINEDGIKSRSHGLDARWLQMQSEALGIPLARQGTLSADYEANFKKVMLGLKEKGVTEGVFGDIDVMEHKVWIDRVCAEVGITPHYPLWGMDHLQIITDFINLGFETVIVAAKKALLGDEWLGRKLDHKAVAELINLHLSPCGEAGEFHTLVVNGPMFKKRLEITEAKKLVLDDSRFWQIQNCRLTAK
jgi:diphthine-ammonia ligase